MQKEEEDQDSGGGGGGGSGNFAAMERRDAGGGSEHSVAGRFFPAEVQLMGFNSELFANLSEALGRPHGVVGVAVMVQQNQREVNPALRTIAQHLKKVGRWRVGVGVPHYLLKYKSQLQSRRGNRWNDITATEFETEEREKKRTTIKKYVS